MKYLYGAAVQGIQEFIFQTNKLREIVGASELVEEICTSKFARLLEKDGKYHELKKQLEEDANAIVHAAGNIKYIFTEKEDCENMVRCFPKEISQFAPGITVSQSVVEFIDDEDFPRAVKQLEAQLRVQRNKPMRYPMLGLMGIERSQQTGLPVSYIKEKRHLDSATYAKLYYQKDDNTIAKRTNKKLCKKSFGKTEIGDKEIPYDISEMTGKNDWIAVVHVDGNGLGQIVQKIGVNPNEFKNFSRLLDEATTLAANEAYKTLSNGSSVIPMRPIVLGGDDHTVICRADLALSYVECFIEEFEKQTEEKLGSILRKNKIFKENYLTACAGISYIKSSFPFYYGYELAEALCSRAKTDAKTGLKDGELPASCIMFHKVQDSFVENYKEVVERELKPQDNISFEFGPYYLKEKNNRWTIGKLKDKIEVFNSPEGNAIKSGLRNWLSLIHTDSGKSKQFLERLKEVSGKREFLDDLTDDSRTRGYVIVYPVYDMLAIHTIENQQTK